MRTLRCVLCASLFLAGAALGGCNRADGCPEGMSRVEGLSEAGHILACRSKDGTSAQWSELQAKTGKPRQVCRFSQGQPQGDFSAYHPNGKPWIRGRFMDGHKSGTWVQFDTDGHKVAEGAYSRGRLVGGAPVAMAASCEEQKL